jgi:hypothetical protein
MIKTGSKKSRDTVPLNSLTFGKIRTHLYDTDIKSIRVSDLPPLKYYGSEKTETLKYINTVPYVLTGPVPLKLLSLLPLLII